MRRTRASLLTLAVLLAIVAAAPTAGAVGLITDTLNIQLPGGANDPARLALRFSQATVPDDGADRVLLATQETFADALASGTLQGEDSPLLLTPPDDVRADVTAEIIRLGVDTVTLLGGVAALDESVAEELTDAGLQVERVAGGNRIETAVEVARLAPESSTAIVSRAFPTGADPSQAFADALAAGGLAADAGWPILLTGTDALAEPTREALRDSPVQEVLVLGGTAAISDAVVSEIEALGVEVVRIAAPSRFGTAVEVAALRGFDDAGDATAIILAEGQDPLAWAAGFSAAAYSALHDAPIVLANGPTLPPETAAFLSGGTFDADGITGPVFVCAADPAACAEARLLLGLPAEATVTLDAADDEIPSRSQALGTIDLGEEEMAEVAVFGPCVTDGLVVLDADGRFALDVAGSPGACTLEFEITFANGSVQTVLRPIVVAPAVPQVGPVIDTETGRDVYTFVPTGATAPVMVAYSETDLFTVDGEEATIGAFEAALSVADQVTFSADTPDGTLHDLVNVDPTTLRAGMIGDVDLSAGTFAIIEPVSGTPLAPGLSIGDVASVIIDGEPATLADLEADLSEGDVVAVDGDVLRLANDRADGPATRIVVDSVTGVVRFGIGALGDDPSSAEDDQFRFVQGRENQIMRVDGLTVTFSRFVAALSEGDRLLYRREDGVEVVQLNNRPAPPVEGLVTEDVDPDGSPAAPEPEDGGELALLTPTGRVSVTYDAGAEFRIDGRLATEEEFEAARTPGDHVSVQAPDAATDTPASVSLANRDLAGDLGDIAEGDDTYDVVTLSGVVYDDLPYTAGIFGGPDLYLIDGDPVDQDDFELLLTQVDNGEVQATIVVRPTTGGTEHRITTLE